MISDLMDFLGGTVRACRHACNEMEKAAEELRFEKAAALRDQMKAMQIIIERQKVVFASDYKDSDVVAMARADGEACVQIFFIRGGKLIGREYFILEGTEDTADPEVMSQFIKQFYTEAAIVPEQVMLPARDRRSARSSRRVDALEARRRKGGNLRAEGRSAARTGPDGGGKCDRNSPALRAQWQADAHKQEQSLAELQSALGLSAPPNRIECYDVSHTQGVATVGAMVVFEQGVPAKKLYRKFNIDSTSHRRAGRLRLAWRKC